MFQFSETSSGKLIFSSLVMLSTMEDRRRRLEDAEDSLVPVNKTNRPLIPLDSNCFVLFAQRVWSLTGLPSLWFIMAVVEWSAELGQVSEDFFQ